MERGLKSLSNAYADVLRDSALVEASRQLRGEMGGVPPGDGGPDLHARRAEMLAESAAWLAEKARQLAELARRECPGG